MDSELNGADASGALGTNLHQARLTALSAGDFVSFPEDSGGAMLGTYFAPCRTIGLLLDGDGEIPYRLSSRGKDVWQCRTRRLQLSPALITALAGDYISRPQVEAAIPEFSLGSLSRSIEEANLLYTAFVQPWDPGTELERRRVSKAYEAFANTIAWAKGMLAAEPDTASALIVRNFNNCTQLTEENQVAFSWAEYEYRRRCHFALELMLAAVTNALTEANEATIQQIVAGWFSAPISDYLTTVWPKIDGAATLSAAEAIASIPASLFKDKPVPINDLRHFLSAEKAFAAIAILAATAGQTRTTRQRGYFDQQLTSPGEQAIVVIESVGSASFFKLVQDIAELAVLSHLQTTLRKMGGGQKCSLRFFPDGRLLRSTGVGMMPGYSNDRLTNVLRILTGCRQAQAH